jgi:hypothetical protein
MVHNLKNGMKMFKQMQMRNTAAMAALALAQTLAMAQSAIDVTVTYGPVDVASVPTLSQWGMIVMSCLLAVAAMVAIRKGAGSKAVSAIVLAAVGCWGAAQGDQLIGKSLALPLGMTVATGGTVPLQLPEGGSAQIFNSTTPPIPLRVIGVTPSGVQNAPTTTCDPGVVVPAGDSCIVSRPISGPG